MNREKTLFALRVGYLTTMLTALYLCNDISRIFHIEIVASSLLLPVVYLLSDIIAEIFGFKKMRTTLQAAFCSFVIFSIYLLLINFISISNEYNSISRGIIEVTPLAILDILIGQYINTYIFCKLKSKMRTRNFFIRSILSTGIGLLFGTIIGYTNRFISLDFGVAFKLMLTAYIYKVIFITILTVPTAFIVFLIKKRIGLSSVNDERIDYNPFKID